MAGLEVRISCDVCSGAGEIRPAAETVSVRLRSRAARVDLCAAHAQALDAALDPVLAAGEQRAGRTAGGSTYPRLRDGEDRERIRAWAQARALPVARTGTISGAVLNSYRADVGGGEGRDPLP